MEARGVLQLLSLPIAVPSIVETHTLKLLRSMGSEPGIITQRSTVTFGPSVTVRFLSSSISTVTSVIGKKCHIQSNEHTVCDLLCCGNTSLLDSRSSSIIVTSAIAGLMITRSSTTGVVRSRKKLSMSSRIMSLVISIAKHCRLVMFENGPTSWLLIDVKSLVPGRSKTGHPHSQAPRSGMETLKLYR